MQRSLTRREKEVLVWYGRGKTAWEIAQIMTISVRTVEWYAEEARDKLDVSSTRQAVAVALSTGLITL